MLVWLASYPRSGNTFLRILIHEIFGLPTHSVYPDQKCIADNASTREATGHKLLPPGWNAEDADSDDALWLVKTHEHRSDSHRAIVVHRDGRDASLSYRDYLRNFHEADCSFEDIAVGTVGFGTWADHARSWWDEDEGRTLTVRFDELVQKPQTIVSRLATFLDRSPTSRQAPTFEELHRLNPRFFHSGTGRDWRRDLTLQQRALFLALEGGTLELLGYDRDEEAEALAARPDEKAWLHRYLHLAGRARSYFEERERFHDDLLSLNSHIQGMESSLSWRITKPLRQLKALCHGPAPSEGAPEEKD